jgi:hypothetical protein
MLGPGKRTFKNLNHGRVAWIEVDWPPWAKQPVRHDHKELFLARDKQGYTTVYG